jgi:hypothetical protein
MGDLEILEAILRAGCSLSMTRDHGEVDFVIRRHSSAGGEWFGRDLRDLIRDVAHEVLL